MFLLNSKIGIKFVFFLLLSSMISLSIALGIFVGYYLSTGTYPSLVMFILVGVSVSFVACFLMGLLFAKITLSPIKQILDAIRNLTVGNYNVNLSIKSHDEFEEMGSQLNFMAKKMQENNQKIELDKYLIWIEKNKEEAAFSNIADGIIGLDANQNVVIFNKAAETITGIQTKDAMGKPIQTLFQLFDENKAEILPTIYCPIRHDDFEGIIYNKQQVTLKTTLNTEIPINMISSKIKESIRANLGCIITIHDLTKEKQLEQMKLDFVSMAAHELRTPITSITGYLSVFMQEMAGKIPASETELLDKIDFASKQLLSLVDNMLNVSRVERGVFSVTVAPMDYLDLVNKIISELSERAKSKGQVIEYVPPTQPIPQIEGDKIRLGEVLSNLIANAINYTPANGRIRITVELKDAQVVTHVQDNGKGIPADAIPHLFQKFYRVVAKLEQASKGNGLGLYISKAIIDVHHGKIWVDSEFGKGSTFHFSLPTQQFNYQTFSQQDLGLAAKA